MRLEATLEQGKMASLSEQINGLLLLLLCYYVSLRVPPSNLRDFQLFGVCPSNKHCPSARCAYAANAVGIDLDIFAL
jgi:hypothetical protein